MCSAVLFYVSNLNLLCKAVTFHWEVPKSQHLSDSTKPWSPWCWSFASKSTDLLVALWNCGSALSKLSAKLVPGNMASELGLTIAGALRYEMSRATDTLGVDVQTVVLVLQKLSSWAKVTRKPSDYLQRICISYMILRYIRNYSFGKRIFISEGFCLRPARKWLRCAVGQRDGRDGRGSWFKDVQGSFCSVVTASPCFL